MKAGHAANLFALEALRRIGLQPAATVYVQSVVEEESTGNGALMTHLRGYRADAVLIPEPEDEKLVRANVGVLWFQIEVRACPCMCARWAPARTRSMQPIGWCRRCAQLEAEWNARKTGREHFEDEQHPINLNIGRIEGGEWASSVPAWCTARLPHRDLSGRERRRRRARDRAGGRRLRPAGRFLANNPPRVMFNGFFAEGYVLEPGSEAEAVLARAHEAATGKPLESFMTAGYLDTRVYALYDQVPALCYGPISPEHPRLRRMRQPGVGEAHHDRHGAVHCRMVRARAGALNATTCRRN